MQKYYLLWFLHRNVIFISEDHFDAGLHDDQERFQRIKPVMSFVKVLLPTASFYELHLRDISELLIIFLTSLDFFSPLCQFMNKENIYNMDNRGGERETWMDKSPPQWTLPITHVCQSVLKIKEGGKCIDKRID